MLNFKLFLESAEYKAKKGESEVVHHLTTSDFKTNEFKPLSHFGTKEAARNVVKSKAEIMGKEPENVKAKHHAVRIKLGKVAWIKDQGDDHSPQSLSRVLHKAGHITKQQREKHASLGRKLTHGRIADDLRKNGIHTLAYKNRVEDRGSTSYMITHSSQVRHLKSTEADKSAKVNWKK